MTNYRRDMLREMERTPPGEPLLLHACCGPCTSAVLQELGRRFAVTGLYYNPNIAPEAEYRRRLAALEKLVDEMPLAYPARLIEGTYDPEAFAHAAAGLEAEPEGGERCAACFSLRLGEAARQARALGIPRFTTTLTVSPHKNADLINRVGGEAAARQGLLWLPSDFKKADGYRRSIELSRQFGLYRQDYCGCVYSRRDSGPAK